MKWAVLCSTVYRVRPDINDNPEGVKVVLYDTQLEATLAATRETMKRYVALNEQQTILLQQICALSGGTA